MITQVKFKNFRHIEELDASLGRLNLIVGPNGCGKTSFLKAIESSVSNITMQSKEQDEREMQFVLTLKGLTGEALISRSNEQLPTITPIGPSNSVEEYNDHYLPAPVMPVKFDIAAMRRPVAANNDQNSFALDGSNLTAAIASAKLNDYSVFEKIRRDLKLIVPTITDVKVSLVNGWFNLKFDTETAQNLDVKFMSDGTLFTLGLLTFLHMVGGSGALFLIDDIDQGLHPLAQKELVTLLRSILEVNEHYQIIATTHSPYLLACMQPQEVLCMHLGKDGHSHMAPLTDHPDFDRWKDEMNPGEFWSLFGDEWVTKKAQA